MILTAEYFRVLFLSKQRVLFGHPNLWVVLPNYRVDFILALICTLWATMPELTGRI